LQMTSVSSNKRHSLEDNMDVQLSSSPSKSKTTVGRFQVKEITISPPTAVNFAKQVSVDEVNVPNTIHTSGINSSGSNGSPVFSQASVSSGSSPPSTPEFTNKEIMGTEAKQLQKQLTHMQQEYEKQMKLVKALYVMTQENQVKMKKMTSINLLDTLVCFCFLCV
jgi:hypothetical protein